MGKKKWELVVRKKNTKKHARKKIEGKPTIYKVGQLRAEVGPVNTGG